MDGHVQIHDPVVIAAQNGFKDTDPCPPTCFGRLSQCVFHKRTWHDGEMAGLEFISYAYATPFEEEAFWQLLLARPELMGSHVGSNGRITNIVYIYIIYVLGVNDDFNPLGHLWEKLSNLQLCQAATSSKGATKSISLPHKTQKQGWRKRLLVPIFSNLFLLYCLRKCFRDHGCSFRFRSANAGWVDIDIARKKIGCLAVRGRKQKT